MKDVRCPNCGQLLLKASICIGEIKCLRCKKIIKVNIQRKQSEQHRIH
ncbi:MAG: Com family DNA-binding transcriptional regulator [Clostridia bacterium]|nr:Com family DNA-binding transcriptional regulator [Clostridia bacterium]